VLRRILKNFMFINLPQAEKNLKKIL